MVLHLVPLAKLNLLSASQNPCPSVTSLLWPFLLRLSFGLKLVLGTYPEVVYAARLFFFRLGRIALHAEPALANNSRLERALRLVMSQRVTYATRSQTPQSDADDFHTLSMIAL
ncbi:hypothetical protein I3843_11G149800 [Carya illinoinensis]|uniref:Uncharacterized protein n=1 Tax=Carya illinoinensis TaxID=32201 RepID=A0A8T1P471_CARIL|nr:hypothetical protein I3760_11G149900 [Carya illinoinensis]KAG6637058.1 hypothetical protein CIPAW_11G154100 [Carya illinoinensis]KAG6637059.1 hypothetical protein CIPAW_11G154100 [Carya illinoinensis]KAG6637060.1 hypothetical protein CIPAW_11G154100 [Carya illinoinensis]KAG6637061.1 hypothetical protein CIPAW_11G154100 [Carya illinoinensis]